MTAVYPLELSANTIFSLFCQTDFSFHQLTHTVFTPHSVHLEISRLRMQVDASPRSIFSIQQLVRLRELTTVFRHISSIRTTPILNHIPVCTFTAIAGCYDTHCLGSRVHLPDKITAFLCKLTRQSAFILQSPHHH